MAIDLTTTNMLLGILPTVSVFEAMTVAGPGRGVVARLPGRLACG